MNEARYREAERSLWRSAGRRPTERRVRLAGTGTSIRVQEVGDGEPVLFVHGGPNAGSTWAPMLEHFDGFRCLLVDRPGTGLSEPYPITAQNLESFGAAFVADVLDGLELEWAHVVASSFGGHLALRSAAARPDRLGRMVQMAAPALAPGQVIPPFMKLLRVGAIRTVINRLPPNQRVNRSIFRQIGHGASLDAGRIAPVFFDWYLALGRHTDTMRNDGAMISRLLGAREAVTLDPGLLRSVTTPTLFLWGRDDGFGGEQHARQVAGLMPHADLVMVPDAGHLPWLDDPAGMAGATARFLTGSAGTPPPGAGSAAARAS